MKIVIIALILISQIYGKSYKDFGKEFQYELNYEQAVAKAKNEKKDLMILMVSNFCPWCQKLEKVVLSKDKINTQVHKKYIPLILNKDEANYPKQFETPMVPTVYFVDYKTEQIKSKVIGYNKRQNIINTINNP
ncbi:MAG: thioredoxin family protein [Arcobacteraceae bacterium]|nr:thioredoxin family protein [Arcobacteraceae bacterium]